MRHISFLLLLHFCSVTSEASQSFMRSFRGGSSLAGEDVREREKYSSPDDLLVFSPSGRLYVVEDTIQATSFNPLADEYTTAKVMDDNEDEEKLNVKAYGTLSIAIRCSDGVACLSMCLGGVRSVNIVPEDAVSKKDSSSSSSSPLNPNGLTAFTGVPYPFHSVQLTSNLVAFTGGDVIDSNILLDRIKTYTIHHITEKAMMTHNTQSLKIDNMYSIARLLADAAAIATRSSSKQQSNKLRVLTSSCILCSKYEIWRVEASGQIWQCDVAAVGRGSVALEEQFLQKLLLQSTNEEDSDFNHKKLQNNLQTLDKASAIKLAYKCMKEVLNIKQVDDEEWRWCRSTFIGDENETTKIYHGSEIREIIANEQ